MWLVRSPSSAGPASHQPIAARSDIRRSGKAPSWARRRRCQADGPGRYSARGGVAAAWRVWRPEEGELKQSDSPRRLPLLLPFLFTRIPLFLTQYSATTPVCPEPYSETTTRNQPTATRLSVAWHPPQHLPRSSNARSTDRLSSRRTDHPARNLVLTIHVDRQ